MVDDITKHKLPDNLIPFVRDGNLLVQANPSMGPHVNATIISVTPREHFMEIMVEVEKLRLFKRAQMYKSVSSCIREFLMDPVDPSSNSDLMQDLVILEVIMLVLQNQELVSNSGLFNLALLIDPDPNVPWNQAGLLDPKTVKRLNLDDNPIVVI